MRGPRTIARKPMPVITLLVVASLTFQAAFLPRAQASLICAGLFNSAETTLPPQLVLLLNQLPAKQRLKFEARFEKRDEVSAEREASRLIARLLVHDDAANLKLKPLLKSETRADSIRSLLNARLDVETNRIELENTLIEIGYSEGSAGSQEWRAFRDRYSGQLAAAKTVAINIASTYFAGLPFFLTNTKTAGFKVSKAERRAWPEVEQRLRARINAADPAEVRKVKYEVALEFVRRIAAIVVLAILTDEFLSYLTPKWGLFKMKVRGTLIIESRERLEAQAFENWKDIVEGFTGTRPADNSPEALEILEQIHATSKDNLWLHLHEGGALSEAPVNAPPGAPAPQTN